MDKYNVVTNESNNNPEITRVVDGEGLKKYENIIPKTNQVVTLVKGNWSIFIPLM